MVGLSSRGDPCGSVKLAGGLSDRKNNLLSFDNFEYARSWVIGLVSLAPAGVIALEKEGTTIESFAFGYTTWIFARHDCRWDSGDYRASAERGTRSHDAASLL